MLNLKKRGKMYTISFHFSLHKSFGLNVNINKNFALISIENSVLKNIGYEQNIYDFATRRRKNERNTIIK